MSYNIKRYGIISDIHSGLSPLELNALKKKVKTPVELRDRVKKLKYLKLEDLLNVFRDKGVNTILVNGDIGDSQVDIHDNLKQIAKKGIVTYVQPGCDNYSDYKSVMDHIGSKYANVINVIYTNHKLKEKDHEIVFLSGTDISYEDSYNVVKYRKRDDKDNLESLMTFSNRIQYPEKTIVVSHIPAYNINFKGLNKSPDLGFGFSNSNSFTHAHKALKGVIDLFESYKSDGSKKYFDSDFVKKAYEIANNSGFKIEKNHLGNSDVTTIIDYFGINKIIHSHVHESSGVALTQEGNPVLPDKETDSLYWNSGSFERNCSGILQVKNGKVSYETVYSKAIHFSKY